MRFGQICFAILGKLHFTTQGAKNLVGGTRLNFSALKLVAQIKAVWFAGIDGKDEMLLPQKNCLKFEIYLQNYSTANSDDQPPPGCDSKEYGNMIIAMNSSSLMFWSVLMLGLGFSPITAVQDVNTETIVASELQRF